MGTVMETYIPIHNVPTCNSFSFSERRKLKKGGGFFLRKVVHPDYIRETCWQIDRYTKARGLVKGLHLFLEVPVSGIERCDIANWLMLEILGMKM